MTRGLKILLTVLIVFAGLILFFISAYDVPAENPQLLVQKERQLTPAGHLEHKSVPAKYSMVIKTALSHFPELREDSIIFELTDYGAPLESTFVIKTLVIPGRKRIYRIQIREFGNSTYEPVLLKNLPQNSQVAIIAHELSHTLYYKQLHAGEIAGWGLQYLANPAYAQRHERFADKMTIWKGLGKELLEYANYVRSVPEFKEAYESGELKWIDKYYLTPAEIRSLIDKRESEVSEGF